MDYISPCSQLDIIYNVPRTPTGVAECVNRGDAGRVHCLCGRAVGIRGTDPCVGFQPQCLFLDYLSARLGE